MSWQLSLATVRNRNDRSTIAQQLKQPQHRICNNGAYPVKSVKMKTGKRLIYYFPFLILFFKTTKKKKKKKLVFLKLKTENDYEYFSSIFISFTLTVIQVFIAVVLIMLQSVTLVFMEHFFFFVCFSIIFWHILNICLNIWERVRATKSYSIFYD